MADLPTIGVVVVNYNGGGRTITCLERLFALAWPPESLRIVLVDNGSSDGVPTRVRERWPDVVVVETGANLGFAAGCNAGFDRLRDADYVAIVNNDALPAKDFLEPLVDAMASAPSVGAANPKVLLAARYAIVHIDAPTQTSSRHDPRPLGVQVVSDGNDGAQFGDGFWGWEEDPSVIGGRFRWTSGPADVLLPVPEDGSGRVELRLACSFGRRDVELTVDGRTITVPVAPFPTTVDLAGIDGVEVINNTGTIVLEDGSSTDRGFLQPDDGRFDEPDDVEGWSGAAVLLRREYIDDLGGFDGRLFLYYEDSDMSWRGRSRGWRYRYVPDSVVHHEHSATAGASSALVRHLSRRNRLVVLTKSAPAAMATRAVGELLRDIVDSVWRDVILATASAKRPNAAHVVQLCRVALGYARLLPHAVGARFRARVGFGAS